eukprot:SAG31_NODE_5777_length_2331_cov_1.705645_1_plen_281_part_00
MRRADLVLNFSAASAPVASLSSGFFSQYYSARRCEQGSAPPPRQLMLLRSIGKLSGGPTSLKKVSQLTAPVSAPTSSQPRRSRSFKAMPNCLAATLFRVFRLFEWANSAKKSWDPSSSSGRSAAADQHVGMSSPEACDRLTDLFVLLARSDASSAEPPPAHRERSRRSMAPVSQRACGSDPGWPRRTCRSELFRDLNRAFRAASHDPVAKTRWASRSPMRTSNSSVQRPAGRSVSAWCYESLLDCRSASGKVGGGRRDEAALMLEARREHRRDPPAALRV